MCRMFAFVLFCAVLFLQFLPNANGLMADEPNLDDPPKSFGGLFSKGTVIGFARGMDGSEIQVFKSPEQTQLALDVRQLSLKDLQRKYPAIKKEIEQSLERYLSEHDGVKLNDLKVKLSPTTRLIAEVSHVGADYLLLKSRRTDGDPETYLFALPFTKIGGVWWDDRIYTVSVRRVVANDPFAGDNPFGP